MRIEKARHEAIHIALEKFNQSVIRIKQAPFFAVERLGGRKFLSSLNNELFLSGG
jgi:hypothetical protein